MACNNFIATILLLLFICVFVCANDEYRLEIKQFHAENAEHIEWLPDGITAESTGCFVSKPITAEIYFNGCTISIQGKNKKKIAIEIRVSSDGRLWSPWIALQNAENNLHWKQELYRYIQYRAQWSNVGGSKAILQKLIVVYDRIPFQSNKEVVSTNISEKSVPRPYVVSRLKWEARKPKGQYTWHSPNKITIHHTWRPKSSEYKENSTIRSIQNYHMDNNGWMDIGYHFLIGTDRNNGRTLIYQGRPENRVGAHTGGNNINNVGVNVIGDYTMETLHPNSYAKLIDLIAWLCCKYNISFNEIYGHRDFGNTTCPGNILYAKIPQIKEDVRKKMQGENSY